MAVAQKYAFVDSEYIRKNIPAFNAAQEQLDNLSQQWEKEVADGYAVLNRCTSHIRMMQFFCHRI
jgi:outer membrane protein